MSNALRDQNNHPTLIATLNSDGNTVVQLKANPTTHGFLISDGTTGSNNGPSNALRDSNFVPTMMAVSSADGKTPIALYADSNGKILVKST